MAERHIRTTFVIPDTQSSTLATSSSRFYSPSFDDTDQNSSDYTANTLSSEAENIIVDSRSNRPTVKLPISPWDQQDAESKAERAEYDFSEKARRSYLHLVDAVHSTEVNGSTQEGGEKHFLHWRQHLGAVLASIPLPILRATLDGSLPHKFYRRSKSVFQFYDESSPDQSKHHPWVLEKKAPFAPAIYMRWLVDDRGCSPSARELQTIATELRLYVSGSKASHEKACEIDCVRSFKSGLGDIEEGRHHYLAGQESRVRNILTWCKAVEMKISEINLDNWDEPLSNPCSYCGYAAVAEDRKTTYSRAGDSSISPLARLVEAALTLSFPKRGFRFQFFVICFLADSKEPSLAEKFFTRCTGSRVEQGGFNVAVPGQCASSKMTNLPLNVKERTWEERKLWRENPKNTPFFANMSLEKERLSEKKDTGDSIAWMKSETARIKKENSEKKRHVQGIARDLAHKVKCLDEVKDLLPIELQEKFKNFASSCAKFQDMDALKDT